jgi:hypothetical protein
MKVVVLLVVMCNVVMCVVMCVCNNSNIVMCV